MTYGAMKAGSAAALDNDDVARSREQIERLCMRNLLTSQEERVFFKDLDSRFLLVSEGFVREIAPDRTAGDIVGKTDFDLFSHPHAAAAFADEQRIIATGETMPAKVELETYANRPDAWVSTTKMALLDDDGRIVGTFGISRDITEQVQAQSALAHQALHDPVTGLANRVALMDRLAQALVSLERQPGRLAVLFLDLDDFKGINDTLGHEVGDQVLVEIARRLTSISRRADTVARLGGDEFVVLCPALSGDEALKDIAGRVRTVVSAPLVQDGHDLSVTASIGAVLGADARADASELVRKADIAMYAAKRLGPNQIRLYGPELLEPAESTRTLAADLRRGIERRELFLLYQPLLDLRAGSLSGVEALVRWRHPERGVIAAADFIPVAEERGLIAQVDAFVLDEALRQLAVWGRANRRLDGITMSVNVSGHELRDLELVSRVASALARHGIAPGRLQLEITESALISEPRAAARTVAALVALGVSIALDDFGTGYSTLTHLQSLPAQILKIDRSFIAQIDGRRRDREILAAVIAMAHALGITVVAEGVENDTQLGQLRQLHCDYAQGYLLARPLAPQDILGMAARTGHWPMHQTETAA
jgi:diguanylate cyclase (GGDEF)-like protein